MERWSLYGGLHKNGAEQRESITTGTIFLPYLENSTTTTTTTSSTRIPQGRPEHERR